MKTILEITRAWDDALTLRDKDVLVEAVLGVNMVLTGDGTWTADDSKHGVITARKPRPFTTDPAAALQAMRDVGITKWEYYLDADTFSLKVWYRKNRKIVITKPPFELACAFAAYAFSELKEGTEE